MRTYLAMNSSRASGVLWVGLALKGLELLRKGLNVEDNALATVCARWGWRRRRNLGGWLQVAFGSTVTWGIPNRANKWSVVNNSHLPYCWDLGKDKKSRMMKSQSEKFRWGISIYLPSSKRLERGESLGGKFIDWWSKGLPPEGIKEAVSLSSSKSRRKSDVLVKGKKDSSVSAAWVEWGGGGRE
jgi:hypothetical protein